MKKLLIALIMSLSMIGVGHASTFDLDKSHTEVGFSIKHLMITNVKGQFNDYNATIDFDTKTMNFNSLEANVVVESVDTGIEKRDNHLKSADFFDAKNYPVITFKMKSYKGDTEGGKMVGDLTIRGTTKEVTLDVEMGGTAKFMGKTKLGFSMYGKIQRKDYGLNWNKVLEAGGLAVGETVKLVIEVEAVEA